MCTTGVRIFNDQRDTTVQNLPKVRISSIIYAVNHNCILNNFLGKAYDPKLNIGLHMFTVLDINTSGLQIARIICGKTGNYYTELQYFHSMCKSLRRLMLELGRFELNRRCLGPFSYVIFRDFVRNDSFVTEIRSSLLLSMILYLTYIIA